MNFDTLVNELLDKYLVTEVSRTPFAAEKEKEEEDCEDCGCEEDNEELTDESEISDEDTSEDD